MKYITTTVGLNIGSIIVSGVKLSFWDLGGQKELQSLWDKVILFPGFPYTSIINNLFDLFSVL
jgi:signal recognition particle receptor subunit beta